MFVNLSFDLVTVKSVYLSDLHSAAYGLSEHDLKKSQFSINRSLDRQIFLSLAYPLHVHLHVLEAFLHLLYLYASVHAVLFGASQCYFQLLAEKHIILF